MDLCASKFKSVHNTINTLAVVRYWEHNMNCALTQNEL